MNRPLMKDPVKYKEFVAQIPMGRWGEVHELAGAAVYLASEASSYMTGSAAVRRRRLDRAVDAVQAGQGTRGKVGPADRAAGRPVKPIGRRAGERDAARACRADLQPWHSRQTAVPVRRRASGRRGTTCGDSGKERRRQTTGESVMTMKQWPVAMVVAGVRGGLRVHELVSPASPAHAAANRVFEIRTYTAPPGKLEALKTRFRDHTIKVFNKHDMTSIALLHPAGRAAQREHASSTSSRTRAAKTRRRTGRRSAPIRSG